MFLNSWLSSFCSRSVLRSQRSLSSLSRRTSRSRRHATEQLENRTLLTVTSVLNGTELSVFSDAGESLVVGRDSSTGFVTVTADGAPVTGLSFTNASTLTSLRVLTGSDDDSIDLSQLNAIDFASLTSIVVDSDDGDDLLTGSADFVETFIAGDGNDTLSGLGGNDLLFGGDGNDLLVGAAGNEQLDGGDGDDTISGGDGDDSITGGDGDDSITGGDGNDTVHAGQGQDTVDGGIGTDSILGEAGNDSLLGGDGDDVLLGGSEHDSLFGGAGADLLNGQGGRDFLSGEDGNDTLTGGNSGDSLDGGAGNDVLNGNGGNDTIRGGSGNDRGLGGGGRDLVDGNSGNDTLNGQGNDDTVLGGGGFDVLFGGSGSDLVSSGFDVSTILMSISDSSITEGNAGTTSISFDVNLSAASTSTITVDFATSNGTASAPSDYTAASGTLTFAAGVVTQSITVGVVSDTATEQDEVFSVTLTNAVGAVLNDDTALATILDDDAAVPLINPQTALETVTVFLSSNASDFGLTADDVANFIVTDQVVTDHNGVTHVYLRQTHQGLPIVGADINVNVASDGSVLSVHSSFVPDVASLNLSASPAMTADEAFVSLGLELAEFVHDSHHTHELITETGTGLGADGEVLAEPIVADDPGQFEVDPDESLSLVRTQFEDRLQWAKTDNGGIELVWTINAQTQDFPGWYDSSISAGTGELISTEDWVAHASYNVFTVDTEGPLYAPRSLEVDPQDPVASPFGWHDTNGVAGPEFTDTRGNNVFAQPAQDDNPIFLFLTNGFGTGPRPDGGGGLNFDFPFDDTMPPSTYVPALTTNLFYTNNAIHDILYQYGFDEASGNFQFNNYGNGGAGGDQVSANALAGSNLGFFNNAFMATPPDGTPPTMAMFEFNLTTPNRTSDVENGIIIHEYVHGLTNRLTGGAMNAGALNDLQSGGMGEGWSDWYALMFTQQAGDQANDARPIGNYVLGQPQSGAGIRRQPYSFDMSVNTQTLGDFNASNQVHNAGELWASALWDMNWLLIDGIGEPDCNGTLTPGLGFDPDLINGTGGNNLALQLVTDALKLQPANPSYLDARDAVLQADMINNNGANQRAIWTAFARRGFGFSASAGADANSTVVVEAFDMPPELGRIQFDALQYTSGDVVGITVCDADAITMGNTLMIDVATSEGDMEQVTLTRTMGLAPTFFGTIPLQRGATTVGNSVLDLDSENSLLSATYVDQDNGASVVVTLQALAAAADSLGDTLDGGSGRDTLISGSGDDSINGGSGNDSINSGPGNDTILGGAGRDSIDGGTGDDVIDGQGGNDRIDAGSGANEIIWTGSGAGDDVAVQADGFQRLTVQGNSSANSFSVSVVNELLVVSEGGASFTLNEDISRVSIFGDGGDDTVTVSGSLVDVQPLHLIINGDNGNDTLTANGVRLGSVRLSFHGGDGDDIISGSDDRDMVDGGLGNDLISGNDGNDMLMGGDGRDTISGGSGTDTVFGNAGNDNLSGDAGEDSLIGGFGDDFLNGNDDNDTLEGGFGNDTLSGSAGDDSVEGNQGRDTVQGGSGNDTLKGGTEADLIRGQGGNDSIQGGDGDDTIFGDAGNDVIDAGDGNDSVQGNNGNDIIDGGDGQDTLLGGGGKDSILGGNGNDALNGASGADLLFGGEGNDSLRGKSGTDRFNSGEGIDTLPDLGAGESDDSNLTLSLSIVEALLALNGV